MEIEGAWSLYKDLYNTMVQSTKRIQLTAEFSLELQKVFLAFSKSLETLGERFTHEIVREAEGENERLINTYHFLTNALLRISQHHKKLAVQVKNTVVDPFQMFSDNYRETNRVAGAPLRASPRRPRRLSSRWTGGSRSC